MLQLYFKKILMILLFFVGLILLGGMVIFVLFILLRSLFPEVILGLISLILAFFITLRLVYRMRFDNKTQKREYWELTHNAPLSFGKDFVQTLKSRENTVHTLAFLTLALVRGIRIEIIAHTPLFGILLEIILIILTQVSLFTLINTLLWCLVHRRWSKQWINASQMLENKELDL